MLQQHPVDAIPCTCSAVSFLPRLNIKSFYSECSFLLICPQLTPIYPSLSLLRYHSSQQHCLASTLTLHFSWQAPDNSLLSCHISCIKLITPIFVLHCITSLCVYLTHYTESSGKKDGYLFHLCPKYLTAWYMFSD